MGSSLGPRNPGERSPSTDLTDSGITPMLGERAFIYETRCSDSCSPCGLFVCRPPHQIMAWVGLERYGYLEDAQRLAYRFLYMMTTAFVDFNGVVPEKVCTIFELLVVVVELGLTSGAMILCVRVVRRREAVSPCGR